MLDDHRVAGELTLKLGRHCGCSNLDQHCPAAAAHEHADQTHDSAPNQATFAALFWRWTLPVALIILGIFEWVVGGHRHEVILQKSCLNRASSASSVVGS